MPSQLICQVQALPLCGRVYIGAEPTCGPHPGFRGPVTCDVLGVHMDSDVEFLHIKDAPAEWPDSEWVPIERPILVPWHRVDSIEWETSDGH